MSKDSVQVKVLENGCRRGVITINPLLFKLALGLPQETEIVAAHVNEDAILNRSIKLLVAHPDLPVVQENQPYTNLMPSLVMKDGYPRLERWGFEGEEKKLQ